MKKLSNELKTYLKNNPLVILTPVDRYLGFSAPISPVLQFNEIATKYDIPILFVDPQRTIIEAQPNNKPKIMTADGAINGSVMFGYGHELLDRNMVKYIILAAELCGAKTVNNFRCLEDNDDKALIALNLANSNIKCSNSWISSARSPFKIVLDKIPMKISGDNLIGKTSGFTAGGVGIQPLPFDVDYIGPFLWSSRLNGLPKIIQNNIAPKNGTGTTKVIRTYIAGGKVVGAYFTSGEGVVNCAGLTRNPVSGLQTLSKSQKQHLIYTAKICGALGFCRIDSTDEKIPAIFEINPLARIDSDIHGFNVAEAILEHMVSLAVEKMAEDKNE